MERITALGIAPGGEFPWSSFEPDVQEAISEGVEAGKQAIKEQEAHLGEHVNGWQVALDLGHYGTKYAYRAAWTFFGVGGNLIEDACYPLAITDGKGEPLESCEPLHAAFRARATAPRERFLVADDVRRREVPRPEHDRPLRPRRSKRTHVRRRRLADTLDPERRSLTPSREANWLPAPREGRFKLALRLYSPKPEVARGTWQPPPIERVT